MQTEKEEQEKDAATAATAMQQTPKAEVIDYGIAQNSDWNEGVTDQTMNWADETVAAPAAAAAPVFAANVPAAAPAAPAAAVDDWNATAPVFPFFLCKPNNTVHLVVYPSIDKQHCQELSKESLVGGESSNFPSKILRNSTSKIRLFSIYEAI